MKNKIRIPRGTSFSASVRLQYDDGTDYPYSSGDAVRFGVKFDPEDIEYAILKTCTYDSEAGVYQVNLTPEDTAALNFGRYWYDVGLQTAAGDFWQIVTADYFEITVAVTKKEVAT